MTDSIVRSAIEKLPGKFGPKQVTVGGYVLGFEFAMRDGGQNPQGFVNAWVMRGWPDYDKAREMYQSGEWSKLIATALDIPVGSVRLGFGQDQFDVRPF